MADNNTVPLLLEIKSKLDGLQQTVQGFKQVADAGEQSAKRVTDAQSKELGLIQQLQEQLKALEEARDSANDVDSIKAFNEEIAKTEKQLTDLTETTPGLAGQLKDIAATAADFTILAAGIGAVAGQIKDLAVQAFEAVKGIAEQDNALSNLSQTTGATKEAIVATQNELVKLGESADSVKGAFAQFDGFLANALKDPLGDAGEQARLLGIDLDAVANSSNKLDTALKQAGSALNPLTLSLEQSAAAAAAFGEDDFAGLVPALENLDEKIKKVQERGQIITPEQSETAEKLFNNLGDITATVEGLTTQIIAELLPATTNILNLVKEGIETLDKDSIEGLKAGVREIGRTFEAIAPIIIGTSKFLVQFAGDFGTAISAILNPFETLNFLITGNSSAVDRAKVSNENLNEVYKAASIAVDKLSSDLERLTNEQNVQAQTAALTAEKQKLFIDRLLLAGTISTEEAAKRKAKIDEELLEQTTANAFEALNVVKNTISQEAKLRSDNLNKFTTEEKRLAAEKTKALQDLERERLASNERILQAEKNLAKEINKLGAEKAIENFEQLKIKERQIVEDKRQTVENLSNLEKGAANNRIKAAKEVNDFQRAINLKEKVDATELTKELIDLRNKYSEARNKFDKADLDQRKQNFESEKADIEASATSQIKALEDVSNTRQAEIQKQIALVDQAEQAGTLSREQAAKRRIELSTQVLNEELSALDKILASTQLTSDQREQLENRRKALVQEIDKIQIEGSAKVRSAIISDINAEIAALEKRKAVVEQEKKDIEDKRKAQASAFQQAQKEFNAVADLADRSNSAVAALKGGLVAVGESFDIASESTEKLQDRILQLEGNIKFLREQVVAGGIDVFINENLRSIDKLNAEIFNRTQKAIFEQEQARLKAVQETNSAIVENLNDALEEQEEAEQGHVEKVNDLKQQIVDKEQEINDEIIDIQNDSNAKIEKIFSDSREREAKERATEIEKIKAERRQLEIDLRKQDEDARKDKAKREADAIVERAGLNKAVRDAQAELDKAGTQSERDAAGKALAEAQAKLKEFEDKNKGREAAEKTKQQKIKEAEELLVKEKGEATTEEEIKAAEARFKARKEAAEKAFQDETDFQDQLAELQKNGTKEEIDALKAKYAEIKKLNDEADVARLKDIDEQLALEKALRAKAEAERQAEIAKQVEEEKKRAQEAIDRLKEQGEKRKEEIKNQIKAENREFEAAEKERNEKIARAIAEVSAGLQIASSQLSDYVTNLAKSLGLAADKIKPIADAIAQINNATKTNSASSNSPSSPSSNPSNPPSNPSNNPFSSPTQGDNNGSAGSLGFNRQAANTNQGQGNNQQNNQNNNNPSSPPTSPPDPPAGPSSNTGNVGISASPNQANQNSQVEPTQGNGQIDDTVPDLQTPEDYKAKMLKIQANALKASGIDPDKTYTRNTHPLRPQNANNAFAALDKAVKVMQKACQAFVSNYLTAGYSNFAASINYTLLYSEETKKDKGQKLEYSFKRSVPRFTEFLDRQIAEMKRIKEQLEPKEPSKFDDDLGTSVTPASPGSNPGDVNAPSSPNSPGGRGNNPSPRSPGSTNPKAAEPIGLSDKEKAFFANRDKDADTGFDESVASGLAGRRGLRPDAAVGGNRAGSQPQDPSLTSNNNSPSQSTSQPTQNITQTSNNQVTVNLQVQGFLGDKKTLDEIAKLFGQTMSQEKEKDQQRLRNLMGSKLLR